MSVSEPLFTLIATTVGTSRIEEIRRLAASIEAQRLGSQVEVLFLYQSQSGEVPRQLEEILGALENCRMIAMPISSLSAARNLGLEQATGRWVGFPDDDCWYPPEALTHIADTFALTGSDAVCVHVMDPENGRTLGRRPRHITHEVTYRRMFQLPISVGLFVRRDSVASAGAAFDLSLGVGARWGAAEETDFVHTLLRSGCRCVYDGHVSVLHKVHDRNHAGEARKAYSYGAAFGLVAIRFLRAGSVGHLPFVFNALFRSFAALGLYVLMGNGTAASAYFDRLRGFLEGALHAVAETRFRQSPAPSKPRISASLTH